VIGLTATVAALGVAMLSSQAWHAIPTSLATIGVLHSALK